MKKVMLLAGLMIAFHVISVEAQTYKIFKGDTINRTDAKGLKQGPWRRYYDNDQLFSETIFKNGKPQGNTNTFYKSGKKQAVLVNSADGKTARMTSFWENGKIKAVGKYINQEKDSTWNYYSENDTLLTAIENYKLGKAHGIWKTFYPTGKISDEITYVNGLKEGPIKRYFTNGSIKVDGRYKADTFEGTIVHFHMNGKPYIKGQYKNGLKEGEWLYLNENGVRDSSETYRYGALKLQ
ncbi:MAG: toxin-antitoxin system YwqK family antitoxin [Bacteroidetes bacterium]|nr:toxin-antitoxin system YwqK family antitoxin [Bacteroidota bacterium]